MIGFSKISALDILLEFGDKSGFGFARKACAATNLTFAEHVVVGYNKNCNFFFQHSALVR